MIVTAAATIALGFFTWVLAKETKRLSMATAQAHVVATLEPNPWSVKHYDLVVANTGNAAAHDVVVSFTPDLEERDGGLHIGRPLRHLSVLKPGQSLSCYAGAYETFGEKTYQVSTGWIHHPADRNRQSLSYELSMRDYADFGHLGARTPFVQMAEQIEKIREDWRYVASGSRHLKADTYSGEDREKERKRREAEHKAASLPPRKPKDGNQ
ncbi:hypothetical protein FJ950_22920 [Mesorhizobium sp. B2-3-14]|nr:hypothetical protein FJ950_22920 [Mesorhizobium sp. B2-3-14]